MTDSLTIITDGTRLVEDAIYAGNALSHTGDRMKYVCARLVLAVIRNRYYNNANAVLREVERVIPVLVSLNAFAAVELFYVAELQMTIDTEPRTVVEFIHYAMKWNRETSRDYAEFQCGCMINWNEVQYDPSPAL